MKKNNKYNVTQEQLVAEAVERMTLLELPKETITLMKEKSLYCRYHNGVFTTSKEQCIKANKKYATYYVVHQDDCNIRFLISPKPHMWELEKRNLSKGKVLVDIEKGGRHWQKVATVEPMSAPSSMAWVYEKNKEEKENQNVDHLSSVRNYIRGKNGQANPPSQKQLINEAVERLKILDVPQKVIELMENNAQPCMYIKGCFATSRDLHFGLGNNPQPYLSIDIAGELYEFYISANPDDWSIEKETLRGGLAVTLIYRQDHFEQCHLQVEELGICKDAPLYFEDFE